MKTVTRGRVSLHVLEVVYSVLIIVWYVLPFIRPGLSSLDPRTLAGALYGNPPVQPGAWGVVTVLSYLLPLICLWKVAAFFLPDKLALVSDPERPLPILMNIVSSGIVVSFVVLHLVRSATNASYFAAFSPITYAATGISLVYNGYFITLLIMSWSKRDEAFQEYLDFRRGRDGKEGGAFASVPRQGIQRRLILTFVPIILVIIVVLSLLLLKNFSDTISAAVSANGQGLAERTASVAKSNTGQGKERIALQEYFDNEARQNQTSASKNSSFRFNTLTYYSRDPKGGGFVIDASTDRGLINRQVAALPMPVTKTPPAHYNPATKSYEFLAPASFGSVTIGYITVDYSRDVIFEPLFRTQVKVIVIAALFMYASVFLVYLLGRGIVFPILFLRMSVNNIAKVLDNMVKGQLKFSSDLLQYKDRIRTQDEIKLLSGEVGNMTSVIRGVIPYVSTSTLKHSQRETPTTEMKNQTFLFTDIRGFTTLCEGMAAPKVVELLNHYLALQTSIINANEGDVDKYVGDEIMAVFEGPKKEAHACKAGLEIRRAMEEEARKAAAGGKKIISIGIGINSGRVVHGSVGALNRMDFTSIGDPVNLAARLEGANKQYGTGSLISEAVYEKVEKDYLCREIDLMTVKGKSEPVRIFEILREMKGATAKEEGFRKLFETSLALYRKQKWDVAEKGFVALKKEFKDETSDVFLDRIKHFKKDPPPEKWDGVFNLTTK
jgi:adenylate cyclase